MIPLPVLLLALLSLVAFDVTAARACGTPLSQVQTYWMSTSKESKQRFVRSLPCTLADAHAPEGGFDLELARILLDAERSGVDPALVRKKLVAFHCVHAARESETHAALRAEIGPETFDGLCPTERLARMYVVVAAAGGAVLRGGPSTGAPRLDAAPQGVLVTDARREGDWFHAHSYRGDGYIRADLLRPY